MRGFIIVVSLVVVLLTAATIIVGSRSFDGVVVEKPYETGLAWDKAEQQKASLGFKVAAGKGPYRVGKNSLVISVQDRDKAAVQNAEVTVKVTRPSTTALDRTYKGERQPDGRYLAVIELPQFGNWDLLVHVERGAAHADYTLRLFAERTSI